ncbi:hypothetical protein MKX01_037397 [Papaver californicum]|nr:hypothetical protein MKX01_037397 [Papaver californicum]
MEIHGENEELDLVTSGKGGIGTYVGLCIISGVFRVGEACVQGGMIRDLSLMCPEFIQSYLDGLAASGALTSALRLVTKAAFGNSRNGLSMYFAISMLFELLCLTLYAHATEEKPEYMELLNNKQLIVQNMDYAVTIFLVFFLTFSNFPGFLTEDTKKHSLGSWHALVIIAMYNVWNLIGRYIPLIENFFFFIFFQKSRRWLLIVSLARFLLIPCFYFTAKYGDQGWMIMLTSLLGLSHGYLPVCVLTEVPKNYKGPEQNALGNLFVLFLGRGVLAGVTLDLLWLIGKGW